MKEKIILGYVPESFPQISETFVINEIWGMLHRGYAIHIVPRITVPAAGNMHGRYDSIKDMIRVINNTNGNFSMLAFLYGLYYGSPVRPRLRISGIVHMSEMLLK